MRNFLLVYVAFMVSTSTIYIIIMSIALTRAIFEDLIGIAEAYYVGRLCIIFASWGADGFMLWRCAMLYKGISRGRRITLIVFLVLMALASFCTGVVSNLPSNLPSLFDHGLGTFDLLPIIGTTVIINFFSATLITLRILYFERYIRKTVGVQRNDSPYMTILIICVESSALIIVFSLIYFILYFQQSNAIYIPWQVLVHIYVLSPLLIVYRVARGRDVTIMQRPSESRPAESSLHFESQALSSSNDEGV